MQVDVITVSYLPRESGGEAREYGTLYFTEATYCKVHDNGVLEVHLQESPLIVRYFAPGSWVNAIVKGAARE